MTKHRDRDEEVRETLSLAAPADAHDQLLPARYGNPASVRRSFGLPIGVSLVVDLPRAPTDREWLQLISEFRTCSERRT